MQQDPGSPYQNAPPGGPGPDHGMPYADAEDDEAGGPAWGRIFVLGGVALIALIGGGLWWHNSTALPDQARPQQSAPAVADLAPPAGTCNQLYGGLNEHCGTMDLPAGLTGNQAEIVAAMRLYRIDIPLERLGLGAYQVCEVTRAVHGAPIETCLSPEQAYVHRRETERGRAQIRRGDAFRAAVEAEVRERRVADQARRDRAERHAARQAPAADAAPQRAAPAPRPEPEPDPLDHLYQRDWARRGDL